MKARRAGSILSLVLGLLGAVAACSSDDGGGSGASGALLGSCNIATSKNCADYFGSASAGAGLDTACAAVRGTWSTTACDTTSQCGYCTSTNAAGLTSKTYYFDGSDPESTLASNCASGSGTWTDNAAVTCK